MNGMNHVAYNKTTGEVIGCSTVNALKRRLKRNARWDRVHGYFYKPEWVFTHGSDAFEKLRVKAL